MKNDLNCDEKMFVVKPVSRLSWSLISCGGSLRKDEFGNNAGLLSHVNHNEKEKMYLFTSILKKKRDLLSFVGRYLSLPIIVRMTVLKKVVEAGTEP